MRLWWRFCWLWIQIGMVEDVVEQYNEEMCRRVYAR